MISCGHILAIGVLQPAADWVLGPETSMHRQSTHEIFAPQLYEINR